MTCEAIETELVAFHFGTSTAPMRAQVEDHLLTCPECLRKFLALKRQVETAEAQPLPSKAAKDRLRRAVAREIGAEPAPRWRWWERPLAFGFASAALVATVFVVYTASISQGVAPHALTEQAQPR